MLVYRIAKSEMRSKDISGVGAFKTGGRWNSPGTYILYTSENSSLAYLENLVHFDQVNIPPNLFIITIDLKITDDLIYTLPDKLYPKSWQVVDNLKNKDLGDQLMFSQQYLAIKVRSTVNTNEYNYLLNPLFPGFHDLAKVVSVEKLNVDARLMKP
jgi:RES domain-containing protein